MHLPSVTCRLCAVFLLALTAVYSNGYGHPAPPDDSLKAATAPPDTGTAPADSCAAAATITASPELLGYYARWNISPKAEAELPFYTYLHEWLYHTPYRWGGSTRQGTDCSGFVWRLFHDLYHTDLPRVAGPMLNVCERVRSRDSLQTGDLLFFSWNGGRYVAHVGIYLQGGYFVHSAVVGGVIVSHLDEPYYRRFYYTAGRFPGLAATSAASAALPAQP